MFIGGWGNGITISLLTQEGGGSRDLFANCRFSAQTSNLFLDIVLEPTHYIELEQL